jgi:hypothetical protein
VQHKHLQFGHGCRVVLADEQSQAADMALVPGESEGGPNSCSPSGVPAIRPGGLK